MTSCQRKEVLDEIRMCSMKTFVFDVMPTEDSSAH